MRLVTQAGYEGDAKDQVLRDTIISRIASEKIRAKIVKEGHKVYTKPSHGDSETGYVSPQHHLDRMQETAKVNYVQYGKLTKNIRRVRSLHSLVQVGAITGVTEAMEQVLSLVEKARSFHSCKTLATDVVKTDIRKHRTVKLWMLCAEVVERRDTLRKSVSRLNIPHIHSRFHKLPPVLQGQGLVNPSTLMMMDNLVFTHMVSVPHENKHLIKFPIALDYTTLRSWVGRLHYTS